MSDGDFLAKLNLASGKVTHSSSSYNKANYNKPRIDNFGTGNA